MTDRITPPADLSVDEATAYTALHAGAIKLEALGQVSASVLVAGEFDDEVAAHLTLGDLRAVEAALDELAERRRDGMSYLMRRAFAAAGRAIVAVDAMRTADAATVAGELDVRPASARVEDLLDTALHVAEADALEEERSVNAATVAEYARALRDCLEADTLRPRILELVEPPPAPVDELGPLVDELLVAVRDENIQTDHLTGRLEALRGPLARLEAVRGGTIA